VASMVGNGCGQGKTVQAIDLLLPLSQYCNAGGNSVTGQPNAPLGHNWYNGLEVKLTKRMQGGATQGLTFQVSYTWSKTINGAGYQNGWPYQDPRQIHYLAGSDRTNVLGITTVYDLRFGKGGMLLNHPNRIVGTFIARCAGCGNRASVARPGIPGCDSCMNRRFDHVSQVWGSCDATILHGFAGGLRELPDCVLCGSGTDF